MKNIIKETVGILNRSGNNSGSNSGDKKDNSLKKESRKNILVMGVAVIAIMGILLYDLELWQGSQESSNYAITNENEEPITIIQSNSSLEESLKNILGQIEGVGEIDVLVTYETSEEIVPAFNTNSTVQESSEVDSQGGERITTLLSCTHLLSGHQGGTALSSRQAQTL